MKPGLLARLNVLLSAAKLGRCLSLALARPVQRFLDRGGIVKVPLAPGQKENMFVGARRPIRDAFWHRIEFVPDNVRAEPPAIRLQGEGDAPRDAHQLLGCISKLSREPSRDVRNCRLPRGLANLAVERADSLRPLIRRLLTSLRVSALPAAAVTVAQIEPSGSIGAQDAPQLAKHANQFCGESLGCSLKADLARNAIVPQAPIRRRGHDTMHGLGRQRAEHVATVADQYPCHHLAVSLPLVVLGVNRISMNGNALRLAVMGENRIGMVQGIHCEGFSRAEHQSASTFGQSRMQVAVMGPVFPCTDRQAAARTLKRNLLRYGG